jgi:succinate-acetate transporter protein
MAEIHEEKLATMVKIGNPAVVGLGGFGMTTLLLQFHNLGWVAISPIIWLGFIFGGGAQLIAGMLEFRTGNNFGFCAFSGTSGFRWPF